MGLLDLAGLGNTPFGQFVDQNQYKLGALGAGLAGGTSLGGGLALGLQNMQQARLLDQQRGQQAADEQMRQTQINQTMKWIQDLATANPNNPQLAQIAQGLNMGAIETGHAFTAALQAMKPAPAPEYDFMNVDGNVVRTDPATGSAEPVWSVPETAQPDLTEGQKAMDREYGKEYVDWIARGGYADVQKQLAQLNEVATKLESGANLTGPVIGSVGEVGRSLAFPAAQAAKEAVEEVVQRNLRVILGAQFTQKEGDRLIARAYNPRLGEAENAKRLRRLIQQVDTAARAKDEAAQYFQMHGTLVGWDGHIPTLDEIGSAVDGGALPAAPASSASGTAYPGRSLYDAGRAAVMPGNAEIEDLLRKYGQ